MTREQVIAKLGEPLSTRTYQGHTYLLYKNGCEKTCGMNDLVVLDSGKVTDAVFRSASRKYSGTSSSPRMFSETEAKRGAASDAPLALPGGGRPAAKAPPKTAAPSSKAPQVTPKAAPKAAPAKTPAKAPEKTPAKTPVKTPPTTGAASKPATPTPTAPAAKKPDPKKPPALELP